MLINHEEFYSLLPVLRSILGLHCKGERDMEKEYHLDAYPLSERKGPCFLPLTRTVYDTLVTQLKIKLMKLSRNPIRTMRSLKNLHYTLSKDVLISSFSTMDPYFTVLFAVMLK